VTLAKRTQTAVALAVSKSFAVRESFHFQIGAATANALNHPNYTTLSLTFGTAAFGTMTTLMSGMGGQVAGRPPFLGKPRLLCSASQDAFQILAVARLSRIKF
jgi:hypothetical protein